MNGPDQVRLWVEADGHTLGDHLAGAGRCAAIVRKAPVRAHGEPCEDAAALLGWAGIETAVGWLLAGSVLADVPGTHNRHHYYSPVLKRGLDNIQSETNVFSKQVDEIVAKKEAEIMEV